MGEEVDLNILLALTPILLVVIIVFIFRKPLYVASPITYVYTLLIAVLIWQVSLDSALGSTAKGLLIAVDITIIIFGAIFFLEFLKKTKVIYSIEHYLGALSTDRRVQAILLVWFLGSFIEGTAGFGTPAAIVAPLLVGIGFPAITAVSIALIGNSTAVSFGAVGTPIRIGFSGLEVTGVPFYAALINLFVGMIVPVMILSVLVLSSNKRRPGAIKEAVPFALLSGAAFTIPYYVLSFFGIEFPSLVGSLIGLFIIIIAIKNRFLVPKKSWDFKQKSKPMHEPEHMFKALLPYILLISFLIIGKILVSSYTMINITESISQKINHFNPGFAFIIAVIAFSIIHKTRNKKELWESASHATSILLLPFLTILFISGFVQLMFNSGSNMSGLPDMISLIAGLINTALLPLLAPFIGGFGAFIAGSATVSNMLFGKFQSAAATALGLDPARILGLQLVGAGAGNMIALTNIVSAEAAVKLHGHEVDIIKHNIIPCLIYLLLAGILGLILVYLL